MGQIIPLVALAALLLLIWVYNGSKLKWIGAILAVPPIVIPLIIPNLNTYKGAELFGDQNTISKFSFITFSKMTHNRNYSEIAKLIDCQKYDIIQVQEIPDLSVFLQANPKVSVNCNFLVNTKYENLVTFSKYPLSQQLISNQEVVNVHLNFNNHVSLINVRGAKAITRANDRQMNGVKRIIKAAEKLEGPVIVAGDFNATHFNSAILLMKKHFFNATIDSYFTSRHSSWPGEGRRLGLLGPWIQIDYIFFKGLESNNTFVHSESYGSDHYPIETTFSIRIKN